MEQKIKRIFLILLVSGPVLSFAQEISVIRAGLISGQVTLSPGKMLSNSNAYFYLHGGLEVYVSEKFSFSGEGYLFRGSMSDSPDLRYNHNLFFGFSRHFTTTNFDFYLGLQPGLAFTEVIPPYDELVKSTRLGVNPLFSTVVGFNYYIWKYVHFFMQTRFIAGQHNTDFHRDLTELRFSAGLGFNINTLKAK